MNQLKIGIVGYGKMGKIREQSIIDSDEAKLVAVYEVSNKQNSSKNIIHCKSYTELLEADVDAIIVSAYARFAADYTIRALKAGKHVFCEKPPSTNSEEVLKVITEEKKTNKILKYGFNHRFHYSVMEAKRIINEGSLGKLLWIRGIYGKAGSIDFHDNWRNYKHYSGGGILLDQGIHMLDLYRYFTGEEFECLISHLTTSFWDIEF